MIKVVDQFGRSYSDTYLKRAKGLVKNNRAYWVDIEHTTICLVSPQNNINNNEEKTMKLTYKELNTLLKILNVDLSLYLSCTHVDTSFLSIEEMIKHYNYCLKKAKDSDINVLFLEEIIEVDECENKTKMISILHSRINTLVTILQSELIEYEVNSNQEDKKMIKNESTSSYVKSEGECVKSSIDEIMNTAFDIVYSTTTTTQKYLLPIINDVKKNINDILEDAKENIEDCLEEGIYECDDAIGDLEDLISEMDKNKYGSQEELEKLENALNEIEKTQERLREVLSIKKKC